MVYHDGMELAEALKEEAARIQAVQASTPQDTRALRAIVQTRKAAEATPLEFLWPGRIPQGKLTLLSGPPGVGKTFFLCEVVATITTGRDWPDQTACKQSHVMWVTPELGLTDTLFPRLSESRANFSHIHWLHSVVGKSRYTRRELQQAPDLSQSLKPFESILSENPIRLLMFDPLSDYLGPNRPVERDERRRILKQLSDLADRCGVAIVCVESSPSMGQRPRGELLRDPETAEPEYQTVWSIVRDPREPKRRLFLPVRSHHGDDLSGMSFEIRSAGAAETASIEWSEEPESRSYAEAMGRVRRGKGIWSFSQTALAETWLLSYLKNGSKASVDIFSDARKVGLTENPLRTALRRIANKAKHGQKGGWSWSLNEN